MEAKKNISTELDARLALNQLLLRTKELQLYSNENLTYDKYIYNNNSSLTLNDSTTTRVSDYMYLYESLIIKVKGVSNSGSVNTQWAMFDANKAFIGVFKPVPDGPLTPTSEYTYDITNESCKYIKATIHENDVTRFSVIAVNALFNISNNEKTDLIEKVNYIFDEYSLPDFIKTSAQAVPYSDFDRDLVTVSDYYAAFDRLADAFESFCTKQTAIGQSEMPTGDRAVVDSSVYDINLYQFAKSGLSTDAHKIIITTGIHGDSEKTGWYEDGGDQPQGIIALYYFLKDLCYNYRKSKLLTYIHNNVRILVVPILNPWGVENHSRRNGNDVDLNRNFDINYIANTNYSGTAAFSESETAAFKTFVESNTDALYCLEIHARGNILLPTDNRWHNVVPNDSVHSSLYSPIITDMVEKYGGEGLVNSVAQGSANSSLYAWVNWIKEIPSSEPELFASLNNEILTFHTDDVNKQNVDYLARIIQGVIRYYVMS